MCDREVRVFDVDPPVAALAPYTRAGVWCEGFRSLSNVRAADFTMLSSPAVPVTDAPFKTLTAVAVRPLKLGLNTQINEDNLRTT